MTQKVSPQDKPEEKNSVPWRIAFTHKDLLAASWGSKKGADLLYHYLHRASWEAKNQKLPADLDDIKVQFSLPKVLEATSLSRGSFHTYMKLFTEVGYVTSEPYSKEITIHLSAIKNAFSNVPEKPVKDGQETKQPRAKRFKLNDCTFVSLPAEQFEKMREESFKLNEMVQSLNDSVAKLNLLVQSLNQNTTIYSTPEARLREIFDARYALEYRDDSDFLGEQASESETDQKTALSEKNLPDLDVLCEDMGLIPFSSANHSYSQEATTSQSQGLWLQEEKAHQSTPLQETVSAELFPPEQKPAPKVVFPDMTKDLAQKDVRAVTPAQQKRIDAAERKAEEKRIKDREADLWRMAERIAGVVVETKYATDSMKAMAKAKMSLEDIEVIMQKFADAGMFDLTKIANYLPTYAARKLRKQPDEPAKITPFPSKGYQPAQPEVIPWKSKTPRNLGAHLNPADYDEEPYVVSR